MEVKTDFSFLQYYFCNVRAQQMFTAEISVFLFCFNNSVFGLILPCWNNDFNLFILMFIFSSLGDQKIWAVQDGTTVIVGGKTNRAKAEFPEEMNRLLDRVPEIVESSDSKEPDRISG